MNPPIYLASIIIVIIPTDYELPIAYVSAMLASIAKPIMLTKILKVELVDTVVGISLSIP
jgi:hypothetical protein